MPAEPANDAIRVLPSLGVNNRELSEHSDLQRVFRVRCERNLLPPEERGVPGWA